MAGLDSFQEWDITLTMKAAARAMAGPHVSTMISRVNAWVPTSMPLLTNMKSGSLLSLMLGRNLVRVSLQNLHSAWRQMGVTLKSTSQPVSVLQIRVPPCFWWTPCQGDQVQRLGYYGKTGGPSDNPDYDGEDWNGSRKKLCETKCTLYAPNHPDDRQDSFQSYQPQRPRLWRYELG